MIGIGPASTAPSPTAPDTLRCGVAVPRRGRAPPRRWPHSTGLPELKRAGYSFETVSSSLVVNGPPSTRPSNPATGFRAAAWSLRQVRWMAGHGPPGAPRAHRAWWWPAWPSRCGLLVAMPAGGPSATYAPSPTWSASSYLRTTRKRDRGRRPVPGPLRPPRTRDPGRRRRLHHRTAEIVRHLAPPGVARPHPATQRCAGCSTPARAANHDLIVTVDGDTIFSNRTPRWASFSSKPSLPIPPSAP